MIGGNFGTTTAALGVDAIVGDPRFLPHPVRLMGSAINAIEKHANRNTPGTRSLRARGVGLAIAIPVGSAATTWVLIWASSYIGPGLGAVVAIWLTSTTVAWKGLYEAGKSVRDPLSHHDLDRARDATSMIVGRDTEHLPESELIRATIETLAENLVDGIVAPVFYAVIGGAPLAMAYRAVNTLDSMVGYKNPRYQDFGWASARLDDLMNYIPARLTAVLLFLVLATTRLAARQGWHVMRRDAHKHPSPNAGIPEAMMAGGLGVQLGGTNTYQGRPSQRALMGEAHHPLALADISHAMRVVQGIGTVLVSLTLVLTVVIR